MTKPGANRGNGFGESVAIGENHLVVGDTYDNAVGEDTGSAYVFDLSGATPGIPTFTFHNPSPDRFDQFGSCVAISGRRVVVGARSDSNRADRAGAAYVFDLESDTPAIPSGTLQKQTP